MLLTMHHIISDGWSHGCADSRSGGALSAPYAAGEAVAVAGVADPVCRLRAVAARVAARRSAGARNSVTGGSSWPRRRLYWNCRLDKPRPAVADLSWRTCRRSTLSAELLTQACSELSRSRASTLFMTLLAVLQAAAAVATAGSRTSWWWHADRESQSRGDGRLDRVLREHAGAAHGCARRSDVSGNCCNECERSLSGSLCASGLAVREAGGRISSRSGV